MNYLDQAGLEYLWGKIKTYVGSVVEGGVGEIVVNWDDIKGKPSTFTPSTHTHTVSQITDFPTNIVTNVTISGSGNAVTNASFSDNTLTITKGTIQSGGDSNTVTQMTDDATSIYWTPLLASYSANNNTETNFVRKLKGVEYNFSEGYFVINETASGIDTMALHIGAVTGDMDLGDGLTINNHGISVSPGGADNSVFRTDGTTSQLKTINNQSIFGTGNINTSYTSASYAYGAGQFELQLESTNQMGTVRATCPFEYSDLAGIPTFKTVNGQSIIGSGNIDVSGGGSDGNNYPTAIGLTYSNGTLEASVDRNGMGSISDNITINWDTLYGKPSWIDNGPYLPLSGGKLTGDLTIGDASEELKVGVIECGTGIRIYDMYSTDEFDGSSYGLLISNEGIWKSGNVDNEVFFTDGTTGTVVRSVAINGTGNAIVNAAFENARLNLTKGTISAGTSGITQSEADGRYVNISGDTMTGDLNVTGHTVNAQTIDVTNVEALQINISGNTNNNAINVNNGGVTAKAFYESSDISLKQNIAPITKEATDAVDCLTFKQFNFKDDKDKTTKYGVVAQEVEAAGLSNLVSANEEGVKSVDYISLLILKIEALEKRITELEAERG